MYLNKHKLASLSSGFCSNNLHIKQLITFFGYITTIYFTDMLKKVKARCISIWIKYYGFAQG